MQNFQGIVFIWTQTYREIFKSALMYLSGKKFMWEEICGKKVWMALWHQSKISGIYLSASENKLVFCGIYLCKLKNVSKFCELNFSSVISDAFII